MNESKIIICLKLYNNNGNDNNVYIYIIYNLKIKLIYCIVSQITNN